MLTASARCGHANHVRVVFWWRGLLALWLMAYAVGAWLYLPSFDAAAAAAAQQEQTTYPVVQQAHVAVPIERSVQTRAMLAENRTSLFSQRRNHDAAAAAAAHRTTIRAPPTIAQPTRPSPPACPARGESAYGGAPDEYVDAVFTYVNGVDPAWRASFDAFARNRTDNGDKNIHNRYRDWGELRYAMRSVASYAPWVRRIFLVVASPSQVPAWLDAQHSRIVIVYHRDLFDDPATQLPTFNSLAIESVLHRIAGLSQRFIYFNNGAFIIVLSSVMRRVTHGAVFPCLCLPLFCCACRRVSRSLTVAHRPDHTDDVQAV